MSQSAMKIVTTFHQPSSVLASLKCRLSICDVEHLIVAKLNRIEVFSLQPTGVRLECSLEISGKVTAVKAIPIPVRFSCVRFASDFIRMLSCRSHRVLT